MSDSQKLIEQVHNLTLPEKLVDRLQWCRDILIAYHSLDLPELYAIEWLVALDSETDHYPTGQSREHFNKDVLNNLDDELLGTYESELIEFPKIRDRLLKELKELSS
ncbi:hypothetical protein A7985_24270 [Pseudoalteromonas luteoviolacea]|uniref:Uncharacterized protein n=1 Tax=Pseudoalteromonas luteoviolacea TaxID=43657 RepID=A0A1C0TJ36_9GAMM|nr:hypothetical protein [Pseudoalteromonas luteoviolacea]OCQ18328.1 hypothetical protein A7985_24270 [Pseudoalteromonas luteoviolacea]